MTPRNGETFRILALQLRGMADDLAQEIALQRAGDVRHTLTVRPDAGSVVALGGYDPR